MCMCFFLLLLRRENGKIDKLTEDLYDASRAIHCNEQMLREIKHRSRDQQKDMVQMCVCVCVRTTHIRSSLVMCLLY